MLPMPCSSSLCWISRSTRTGMGRALTAARSAAALILWNKLGAVVALFEVEVEACLQPHGSCSRLRRRSLTLLLAAEVEACWSDMFARTSLLCPQLSTSRLFLARCSCSV